MHPASSWTALGQVVATLLSLSPLSLPWLAVLLCSIFLFLVRLIQSVDAPKAFSSGPHSGRYVSLSLACCSGCPTGPHWCRVIVLGFPVLLWYRSVYRWCRGGRGRDVVIPSAPRIEPTPPPADDFVPSHDGVLALIRDELQALQSQLIPKSPPLPVQSVAGCPQSGELPF